MSALVCSRQNSVDTGLSLIDCAIPNARAPPWFSNVWHTWYTFSKLSQAITMKGDKQGCPQATGAKNEHLQAQVQ